MIEDPCPTCHGTGATRTVKRYRVNIPAGVRDGSRVRLAGKGEPGRNGGPPGDLYVITRVAESPVFKRKGDHVEVEVPLTIPEAIRGADVEVPTLNGTKKLRVPAGTKHGTVQRLRGEGPPRLNGKGRGDIHYRFVIDVPASLSKEQKEAVDELSKVMNGNPRAKLFAGPAAGGGDGARERTRRTRTTRIQVAEDRGVFMISVAAELAEMHPQTLRMYEARGLIEPKRSPKGTRLYSHDDVERLRRIQEMTAELGLNLAGVERVLELEAQLERMRAPDGGAGAAGRPRTRRDGGGDRAGPALLPRRARALRPRRRAAAGEGSRAPAHVRTPRAARSVRRRRRTGLARVHMQPDRFTIKSQEALQAAQRLAEERRNPQLTPEHLLAVRCCRQDLGACACQDRARRSSGGGAGLRACIYHAS